MSIPFLGFFFGLLALSLRHYLARVSYSHFRRGETQGQGVIHRFLHSVSRFLRTLGGQAAAAIQNSQLYEQTKKQAIDLEKANQVKDEFLGVMSHELRTPLNVIAGYTKIVQGRVLGEINAEQVKALDKVSRQSNELLVLVNSIMNATKIEAGAVIVDATSCLSPNSWTS
jgi:signal transduction histidine kinase